MQLLTKTPFGCRPSQLLGPWLIESQAYDDLYDRAAAILASEGEYKLVAEASQQQAEAETPLYTVENGIARFELNGPMTRYPTSLQSVFGGTATLPMQKAIRRAAGDGFVQGGFFEVNSPGGTTDGLEDFCGAIADFRGKKPVRMHMGTACSAALRAGIEGDVLTIDPFGITGSVGTLTRMRDTSELMKRAGVKDHYIASGDRKVHGAPGTVVTEEQIADRKALIDAINKSFLQAVETRRPRTKEYMKDIARAGLYDARKAVEIGLADAVMTTDQSFEQFSQRIPFGDGRTLPG